MTNMRVDDRRLVAGLQKATVAMQDFGEACQGRKFAFLFPLGKRAYVGSTSRARCADCDDAIGRDGGPQDGWRLEDGRTVCHVCCVKDTKAFAANLKAPKEG